MSFAGEGSTVRKKAKEKADSEPRSKTERGEEWHIFEFFRNLLGFRVRHLRYTTLQPTGLPPEA